MLESLCAGPRYRLYLSCEPLGLVIIRHVVFVELWYEGEADVPQPGPVDVERKRAGVHPALNGQLQHVAGEGLLLELALQSIKSSYLKTILFVVTNSNLNSSSTRVMTLFTSTPALSPARSFISSVSVPFLRVTTPTKQNVVTEFEADLCPHW